mgnify:CR=1 FL=1
MHLYNHLKNKVHRLNQPKLQYQNLVIRYNFEMLLLLLQKSLILDPVNILKRGFSYTLYNNKPVYDANEVPLEAEIETVLYKGSIKSKKTK